MIAPAHEFACPLCGYRFREGREVCGGCPLARRCDTICCPHCGYRFVSGSHIVAGLRRLLQRLARRTKEDRT